jgi:hypothetical protein
LALCFNSEDGSDIFLGNVGWHLGAIFCYTPGDGTLLVKWFATLRNAIQMNVVLSYNIHFCTKRSGTLDETKGDHVYLKCLETRIYCKSHPE